MYFWSHRRWNSKINEVLSISIFRTTNTFSFVDLSLIVINGIWVCVRIRFHYYRAIRFMVDECQKHPIIRNIICFVTDFGDEKNRQICSKLLRWSWSKKILWTSDNLNGFVEWANEDNIMSFSASEHWIDLSNELRIPNSEYLL